MSLKDAFQRGLAGQLAHPSGRAGRVIGRVLNRMNDDMIADAVDALGLVAGATAADIGFGGGSALSMLLDRVGAHGQVHGIEVSREMLDRATRRFAKPIEAGTLALHEGTMSTLPLDDSALDGVLTINTIYFVDDLGGAFAEVAGVLKPAGRFVVGIRDPAAMARMPVTAHGFQVRPVDEVIATLEQRGLRLTDHRRSGSGLRAAHLLVTTPDD